MLTILYGRYRMDDTTNTNDTNVHQDSLLDQSEETTGSTDLLTLDEQANSDTATLLTIESSIKTNIAKIDRVKEDVKPVREMMKSFLEGDEQYMQATEAAKKASQLKTGRKKELLETQNGKDLKNKLDALKMDLDEAQEALSYYLREYQRLTGLNEFEGEDGELRQIVSTVKLVRKTNLNK